MLWSWRSPLWGLILLMIFIVSGGGPASTKPWPISDYALCEVSRHKGGCGGYPGFMKVDFPPDHHDHPGGADPGAGEGRHGLHGRHRQLRVLHRPHQPTRSPVDARAHGQGEVDMDGQRRRRVEKLDAHRLAREGAGHGAGGAVNLGGQVELSGYGEPGNLDALLQHPRHRGRIGEQVGGKDREPSSPQPDGAVGDEGVGVAKKVSRAATVPGRFRSMDSSREWLVRSWKSRSWWLRRVLLDSLRCRRRLLLATLRIRPVMMTTVASRMITSSLYSAILSACFCSCLPAMMPRPRSLRSSPSTAASPVYGRCKTATPMRTKSAPSATWSSMRVGMSCCR